MGFPKRCLAPALPLCNTVAKIAALSGKTGASWKVPPVLCSLQFLYVPYSAFSSGILALWELGLLPFSVALLWG